MVNQPTSYTRRCMKSLGHASGQLNPGVGETKETLKNYASTLEEGRADLVGLYYLYNPKNSRVGLS